MTKIAVTGGGGFIGAATIAYAESQGHEAWRFDRQDGNDVQGDLSGLQGAEVVIHLAGVLGTSELFDRPHEAVLINVNGTINVLNWCRDNGAGYVGITMPDSEWANVYQATKLCSMRLSTAWHRTFGVPVSHVRAFNAYGPGQKHGPGHPQKIIPTFATRAWNGQPIPIWGDGTQTVDLVHADDIAHMLVDATDFGEDQILDAGTGVGVQVNTIATMVNRMCGQPNDNVIHYDMRPGETEHTNIRAKGEGWDLVKWSPEPVVNNWARLKETVDYYRP